MQIEIISGPMATGKTTRLRAIQADLQSRGVSVEVHVGSAFTTPFFVNLISTRALAGDRCFLADDCTQFQIREAMGLKAQGLHSGIPSDFFVYLVRQASEEE